MADAQLWQRRVNWCRGHYAMPWDEAYYPRSMRNLPIEVRLKAIEIANALLAEGYDEGKAIRIAIARSKEWAGPTASARPRRPGGGGNPRA